jgi:hypothetical protein
MKRLREYAKDQIRVTQHTEGPRCGEEFRAEVRKKGGQPVLRALASVVNS